MAKGLTDKQLQEDIELHEQGKPRKHSSWSPGRVPQFWSAEEEQEFAETGELPKSAADRYTTELRLMKAYNFRGEELTGKDKKEALADSGVDVTTDGSAASREGVVDESDADATPNAGTRRSR